MKLSELVAYRQQLQDHRPGDVDQILHQHLQPIMHFIATQEAQFPQERYHLEKSLARIIQEVRGFDGIIDSIARSVDDLIAQHHSEYLNVSYRLYADVMRHEPLEHILKRSPSLLPEVRARLLARVQLQSDWHKPGMIIRPGREEWTRHLVGLDPLYLVDQHHELLQPAIQQFTTQYQRRLRPYIITETEDDVQSHLPSGQMGYVLAYNFFNYKPFEIMQFYLREIWRVMAPGGALHLTFNDCDRRGAVELVERNFCLYQPGSMVLALIENIGFEIQRVDEVDAATTWVEARRPGERDSLRGGQTLAKIIDRSEKTR